MADTFTRHAIIGGDPDAWGPFELAINSLGIGALSRNLYLDGADLKLSAGYLGFYNGSQRYKIENAAAQTISIVGLTASRWAKIEISIGVSVVIEITSIGAGTDPATLPTSFTGAFDPTKGGFYETATKRILGLVWINAAGAVEGIVNAIGGIEGYSGYSTSDDAIDQIFVFQKINYSCTQVGAYETGFTAQSNTYAVKAYKAYKGGEYAKRLIIYATAGAGGWGVDLPDATIDTDREIEVVKIDSGVGTITLDGNGAQTINGLGTIGIVLQWDSAIIKSNGSNWIITKCPILVVDSAALAVNQVQALAHGLGVKPNIIDSSLLCVTGEAGYSAGDEIQKSAMTDYGGGNNRVFSVVKDATNITTLTGSQALLIQNKGTAALTLLTMANWKIRIRFTF
jgi:hypothetical protein